MYIRNNNIYVLVGDVYCSGQVVASVDLRVDLRVGLMGVGQSSFNCQLIVHAPRHVPPAGAE